MDTPFRDSLLKKRQNLQSELEKNQIFQQLQQVEAALRELDEFEGVAPTLKKLSHRHVDFVRNPSQSDGTDDRRKGPPEIVAAAERILRESGCPTPTKKLIEALRLNGFTFAGRNHPVIYVSNILSRASSRFRAVGREGWVLAEGGAASPGLGTEGEG